MSGKLQEDLYGKRKEENRIEGEKSYLVRGGPGPRKRNFSTWTEGERTDDQLRIGGLSLICCLEDERLKKGGTGEAVGH